MGQGQPLAFGGGKQVFIGGGSKVFIAGQYGDAVAHGGVAVKRGHLILLVYECANLFAAPNKKTSP